MIRRQLLRDFDWWLLLAILSLATIGIVEIWSATQGTRFAGVHLRQLYWVLLGLGLMLIVVAIDYRVWLDQTPLLYIASIVALTVVLILGHSVAGSKSWLVFKSLSMQPSELTKVVVVLTMARFLSELRADGLSLSEVAKIGVLAGLPIGLVLLQPDLGTALTYLPIVAVSLWLGGLRARYVVALVLIVALVLPIGWMMLKPYQKDRLLTFLYPEHDPLGGGYQISQSKIAVGSGGFLGKGLLKGSQNRLGFVPSRHTDFIFSVVAEELGFLGTLAVFALYMFVIFRSVAHAMTARDRAGVYLIMGVVAFLFFHFLVNVGMVIGVMPITGIPLPLLSYGGSSILCVFLALGLVLNVRMRRLVN